MRKRESQFSLGLDYGTESARAVLLDASTGEVKASASWPYRRGVIDEFLPGDKSGKLPRDWALQDPADWLAAFEKLSRRVLKSSKVRPEQIIGIGVDFTSCTILPASSGGIPLCFEARWRREPHAWPKLWKHHGAWREAEQINEAAQRSGEKFLRRYGGKVSSEWMLPKLLQILREAPGVAEAMGKFIEAQDWLVGSLTGQEKRSACAAGYKGTWSKKEGFPSVEFLKSLNPSLPGLLEEKVGSDFHAPGTRAGALKDSWAAKTGLASGTPVAVSIIDAHSAVLGAGVAVPNEMVICMGTSSCHLLLSEEGREIEGISGVVEDGILPGYFGYEAGQAATGDLFAWFVKNACPGAPRKNPAQTHARLQKEALSLLPGESGLLALDWWNGNRSVLSDASLSGALFGLTLSSKPAEIYRALIEATAMGTRRIIDQFESSGVPVKEIVAAGGIAEKNPLLLQIYADVANRPLQAVETPDLCARGAAILGALAAEGDVRREVLKRTVERMAATSKKVYSPIRKNVEAYEKLYKEYVRLHDHFGRGEPLMKNLREIRN